MGCAGQVSPPPPNPQSSWHGSQALVCCRMNSLRRSSLFDKPHFTKVTLTRTPAGYGLELQGSSPAVISHVCESLCIMCVCVHGGLCALLVQTGDTTPTCLLNLAFPLLPTVQLGPRLRGHVCMRETECWRSMV